MKPLQGKIAWVTGAGSGIGLAGALALGQAGARVVLSGRRPALLEEAARQLLAAGGDAEIEPVDVADAAAVSAAAARIASRHGGVDILVNSAGLNVANRYWKDQTGEGWRKVVAANLDGCYFCIAAALPGMRARGGGVIINVSSWAGRYDTYLTGPAYNAAKHGVVALTAHLNMEEGPNGIRACALCPGEVATPIMKKRPVPPSAEDLARMLQPEDMGRAILWIATQPPHMCVNELVVSPTWNRIYLAASGRKA